MGNLITGSVVTAANWNANVQYFTTIALMQAASINTPAAWIDGQVILCGNYAVDNDEGGGLFSWQSSSNATPDYGIVFAPNSSVTSVSGQTMATGNGVTLTFSGTFATSMAYGGLVPQSLTVTGSITDNGGGVLSGTNVTGTIIYATGAWTLTYSAGHAPSGAITGAYNYCSATGKYVRIYSAEKTNAAWFNINPSNSAVVNTNNLATALYSNNVINFNAGTYNLLYIVLNQYNLIIGSGIQSTILNCTSAVSNATFITIAAFGATVSGTNSTRFFDSPLANLQITTSAAYGQGLIGLQVNVNLVNIKQVFFYNWNIAVQFGTTNVFCAILDFCCFFNNSTCCNFPAIVTNTGEQMEFSYCEFNNCGTFFNVNDTGAGFWEIEINGGSYDYPTTTYINYSGSFLTYISFNNAHIEDASNPPYFITSTANNLAVGNIRFNSCYIQKIYSNFANTTAIATFTASSSGTTLTVTGSPTGTITVGTVLKGATNNFLPNTQITGLIGGTGGAGTYTISQSQAVGSQTCYTLDPANCVAFILDGCRPVSGGYDATLPGFHITDAQQYYDRTVYSDNSQWPQNFTPVSGTTYYNTSPSVVRITVPVTFTPTGAAAATVYATITTGSGFYNGVSFPTMSFPISGPTGQIQNYIFDVPPGASYVITGAHVTLGVATVYLF